MNREKEGKKEIKSKKNFDAGLISAAQVSSCNDEQKFKLLLSKKIEWKWNM